MPLFCPFNLIHAMVEPVTISFIVGLIVSGVIIIAASFTIIKNGKDISDSIAEWFRNRNSIDIEITKASSVCAFVAMCSLFERYKGKINCDHWQLITVSDSKGINKSFSVPSIGRYITVEMQDNLNVVIRTSGDFGTIQSITGFKIFFNQNADISKFIKFAFKLFLSEAEIADLVSFYSPIPRGNPPREVQGVTGYTVLGMDEIDEDKKNS